MTSLAAVPLEALVAEIERRRTLISLTLDVPALAPDLRRVIVAVAAAWGQPPGSLFRKTRARSTTDPRQAAMVILRVHGRHSLSEVAAVFGMDHGTVMHSVATHSGRMTDGRFAARYRSALHALALL